MSDKNMDGYFQIQNRRYIGSKARLTDWIFSILEQNCSGESFLDLFAGTGVVGAKAFEHYSKVSLNDFLDSNYIIYQAFIGSGEYDFDKLENLKNEAPTDMENVYSNYFSSHYAGKFYSIDDAKAIGEIREYIKGLYNGKQITERENYILIASLLYSMDKSANTVGHYESYRKNISLENKFQYKLIEPSMYKAMSIYEKDANGLVKEIESDIVYIDPPYNSRQYSRFYHLLENVATWNKPEVFGTALKPPPTNLSEYCRVGAKQAFSELVKNIKAKYIAVSYNNTYNSKSSSSANKMTLEQIREILESKGRTDVHEKPYKHFNAGNTNFNNHKELLFVTEVRNG